MAMAKRAKKAKSAVGGKRGAAAKTAGVKRGATAKKAAGVKLRATAKKGATAKKAPAAKKRAQARRPAATPIVSILDHVTLPVRDYAASKAFYAAALAPLGVGLVMEFGTAGGFGSHQKPAFWIGEAQVSDDSYWRPEHRAGAAPVHIAFCAPDRATVDAFHAAALAAGGVDHGAPGLRPHYHAGYYGAFVLDPDGHNVEVVHHTFD